MQQVQQTQQLKPVLVSKRTGLLDPNFKYIRWYATDIMARFRAMGWVPPSEIKNEKTN